MICVGCSFMNGSMPPLGGSGQLMKRSFSVNTHHRRSRLYLVTAAPSDLWTYPCAPHATEDQEGGRPQRRRRRRRRLRRRLRQRVPHRCSSRTARPLLARRLACRHDRHRAVLPHVCLARDSSRPQQGARQLRTALLPRAPDEHLTQSCMSCMYLYKMCVCMSMCEMERGCIAKNPCRML